MGTLSCSNFIDGISFHFVNLVVLISPSHHIEQFFLFASVMEKQSKNRWIKPTFRARLIQRSKLIRRSNVRALSVTLHFSFFEET